MLYGKLIKHIIGFVFHLSNWTINFIPVLRQKYIQWARLR